MKSPLGKDKRASSQASLFLLRTFEEFSESASVVLHTGDARDFLTTIPNKTAILVVTSRLYSSVCFFFLCVAVVSEVRRCNVTVSGLHNRGSMS